MSENGSFRPRRAMDPEAGAGADGSNGPDDTRMSAPSPARRGAPQEDDGPVGQQPADPHSRAQGHRTPTDPHGPDDQLNPFARPGSQSASQPVSATSASRSAGPVLPEGEGRRQGGVSQDTQPVPRRSAVSSTTPPEHEMIPAPSAGAGSPGSGSTPAGGGPAAAASWFEHHRRTLTIWAIGALIAAVVIAVGSFIVGRSAAPEPTSTGEPTATAPDPTSPTVSESPVPEAGVADLMTVEDAELVVPGASWAVAATFEQRSDFQAVATCLSGEEQSANTVMSLQRTLGTSEAEPLAAMHQIDVYASVEAARQVHAARVATLASCDQFPARIISSMSVWGIADEVQHLTIAYENEPAEFHTLLLVRNGRALTTVDVFRAGTPVEPQAATAGIVRSLGDLCGRVDGACPNTPSFSPTVPPPAEPTGWLLVSDLPRITPGTGQWTATDPTQLTSRGMGCENIPLATEPGPESRAQRTYLLTQDENRPETFGVDEMTFDFPTPEDAAAFASMLGGNLAGCKDRVLTATVTEAAPVTGVGADGAAVSARAFTIQQATSETSSVIYQLTVTVTEARVSYLLTSVTEEFKFTDAQVADLALRAGQRLSQ